MRTSPGGARPSQNASALVVAIAPPTTEVTELEFELAATNRSASVSSVDAAASIRIRFLATLGSPPPALQRRHETNTSRTAKWIRKTIR